jgi:ATP-dependent RNA helicase RhlE
MAKGFNKFRSSNRGETFNFNSGGRVRKNNFSRPSNTFQNQGRGRRIKQIDTSDLSRFQNSAKESAILEQENIHQDFDAFNLSNPLLQNILNHGFTKPTPIQDQAIAPILDGRDLIGLASTGTGKTAAFLIPIINRIFKDRQQAALIITPTRELAVQINDELKTLAWDMKIFSSLIIGGANIKRQMFSLQRNPHIVIATPGRLKDLVQRGKVKLEDFSIFVLDEVDLMVDIGFISDVKYFISLLPYQRQSLFFSATISSKIQDILQNFVENPVTVTIRKQSAVENIDQDVIKVVDQSKKVDQLHDLLIKDGFDKVLIFGRTKHGIDKLNRELLSRGFKTGAIHGNKNQNQRQRALDSFKQNEIQILLATDVASRGLDIPNVTHVINYELPETFDDYTHRIGRTGRANKKGAAFTFVD